MADPTAVINHNFKDNVESLSLKVKSAEALMSGGMVAVDTATGLLEFADDAAGLCPGGCAVSPESGVSMTGTNLGTKADVGVSFRGNVVLRNMTVTGVSSYADILKLVYMTDGQTFTLTRPSTDAVPYAIVVGKERGTTTTTCDIYIFDLVTAAIMSAVGGTKQRIHLGYVEADALLDATDAIKLLDVQMFGHGKITKIYAVSQGYNTDLVAGSVICGFSIEGTTIKAAGSAAISLTLTEASVDAAADRGTTIDLAAAIAAANEFHDGDNVTMNIVNAGSTPFSKTAGTGWGSGWNIEAEVEYLPGA